MKPTVSVVIAAYNGAEVIGETLASLSAQMIADWEAIVIDDGSTDDMRAVVAAWPDPHVRLVAMPAARYVAGLDQDDLCRPERFDAQIAYLEANPSVVLAGTALEFLRGGIGPRIHLTPASPRRR